MRIIDRTNIENWSKSADSKTNLPILISKLVRATTPMTTTAEFPSGTAANVGGWDGIVNCIIKTTYVPEGISLWEFGTESSSTKKATEDYEKRTNNPLGFDTKDSTFIFLTPKFWRDKTAWQKTKQAENKWKEVIVYDSRNIEEWLDLTPPVSIWFAKYLKIMPFNGFQTSDIFWEEWSIGPKCTLSPQFVTAGRQNEINILLDFLSSTPSIKAVQASTKDEAIAFIIASALQFEEVHEKFFFSKTLIVDSEENYRALSRNLHALNLIPRFENAQPLFAAVGLGHHVLVPLGADDNFNLDILQLPGIDKDGQIKSLVENGLDENDARKFSKESGSNITILKRFLDFPQFNVSWIDNDNIRELIPAMLLGRWNEDNIGDRKIIEKLSGQTYEEYSLKLSKWLTVENAPIMQIGSTWRLTSPLDIWTSLSNLPQNKDFVFLKECFMLAFKNGNPIITNDNDYPVAFFNKEKTFSNWSREGLAQSLILIGTFGETLKMNIATASQNWVDEIIEELLNDAQADLWVSLNYEMPLIAEASPESFTGSVLNSLAQPEKQIMAMFTESAGIISPSSNHSGLLWALEGLAWFAEFLPETSIILAKLAAFDPGGNLINRPINSLLEIFKPWHYQTFANLEQRKEVLQNIIKQEKNLGWSLFRKLLPSHHGVAHPTHKMRWRMLNTNTNFPRFNKDVYEMYSFSVDQLIANFDFSEEKFADLLEDSDSVLLPYVDRVKITNLLLSEHKNVTQEKYVAWHGIRKILYNHKSHPDSKWGLPLSELKPYESLYKQLEPTDPILKHKWLFDDQWPELPEGFIEQTLDIHLNLRQEQINNARLKAILEIEAEFGISRIIELSKDVKQPWTLGEALAKILHDLKYIKDISMVLLKDNELNIYFVYSFFSCKSRELGLTWTISLFESLQQDSIANELLAKIFIPLNQGKKLWNFIDSTNYEIINQYWALVQPHFYHLAQDEKIQGIDYLIKHKRYFTAIHEASHFVDDLPSQTIVNILEKAATDNETTEDIQFREFEIGKLFETLDERKDVVRNKLIQLEWFYLLVLHSSRTGRSTKVLHEELANNPEFLVEILKYAYTPKNKDLTQTEVEGLSKETIRNRAHQAFKLLYSWKTIPGINADFSVNQEALNHWVNSVRELSTAADRLEVADNQIGKILAQYPEKGSDWPPIAIAEIIEKINTSQIKSGFSTALFNKRSFSGRGPFDGGAIERGHATYFADLAKKNKINFPNLSKIFSALSKGYLQDAKKMDEDAERTRLDY
jgi:hypothetical protein